jgi:ribosomal protein S18 acetylase RimI-like enzyme
VGDVLIQQAIQLAQTLMKKRIWLGVWEENYRAVNFYKKHGFEPFGTHSFEFGSRMDTDVLMRKTLKY